jgi:glyoxylase-like metal-dependent hydrolase (beta-lactamase superfamily II)
MIAIRKFPSGPFATNTYIVSCPNTKEAVIIDPAPDSTKPTVAYISRESLNPTKILLTHSHWDHIADIASLKQSYPIPVFVHPLDAPNLKKPGSDGLPLLFPIEGLATYQTIEDREIIPFGEVKLEVIHTPGHSPGGVSFWCEEEGVLFSGDTLFRGTIGNLSFPTCDANAMWDSLKKLSKLDPKTKVYPGHGPPTTIGDEHWLSQAQHYFGESL